MQYQNDHILRLVEQLGSMMRLAFCDSGRERVPLSLSTSRIRRSRWWSTSNPNLFLRFSPQSMVSFLELSGFDDRLVVKLAEAMSLQAEILESEGSLVAAGVRREQVHAVLESIDPARAN